MIIMHNYGFLPDGRLITTSEANSNFSIILSYTKESLRIEFPKSIEDRPEIKLFCKECFIPILKENFGRLKKINEYGYSISSDRFPIEEDKAICYMIIDFEYAAVKKYNTLLMTECELKMFKDEKTKPGRKKTTSTKSVSSKKNSSTFFDNFGIEEKNGITVIKRSNYSKDDKTITHVNIAVPSDIRDEWKDFFDKYNLRWGKGIAIAIEYLMEQSEKGNVIFK